MFEVGRSPWLGQAACPELSPTVSAYSPGDDCGGSIFAPQLISPIPNLVEAVRFRAGNAVAAMIAGPAGSLLWALAYRQCHVASEAG
jgi:hypothetical protein